MTSTNRREALATFGFGLAVLLTALWVGAGPPESRGALGSLFVAVWIAIWELERLVRRWTGIALSSSEAREHKRREFRGWARLGALGLGLALLGALGRLSLGLPLVIVLLGIAAWGLAAVWQAARSASTGDVPRGER